MQVTITAGEPIVLPLRVFGPLGSREMDALLDTGASFTTIPPEDAIDLGYRLDLVPKVTVATANGLIQAPRILLSSVLLCDFEVRDVQAICVDIAGGGVSSLLGLSLLARFNIKLDWKKRTLEITDP